VLAGAGPQQLLVVLDNCEHVTARPRSCALRRWRRVMMCTRREPLAVAGEARYRLGRWSSPLAVRRRAPGPGGGCSPTAWLVDARLAVDGQTA
jgi:hypothetical protein